MCEWVGECMLTCECGVSFYLSVSFSVCGLSVSLSFYLSVFVSCCFSSFLSVYAHIHACLCMCAYVCVPMYVCLCMYVYVYIGTYERCSDAAMAVVHDR